MSPLEKNYQLIGKAIGALFSPLVEVVLHDLKKNRISFISGASLTRKIGDPSHLSKEDRSSPLGIFGPYEKVGEHAALQQSISVVLGNENNIPAFMLCINLHVEELARARDLIHALISHNVKTHLKDHFSENWQDKINLFIKDYLKENAISIGMLSKDEKIDLIVALKKNGAFNGKHAAQYIAESLKISRASVYTYIKE